MENRRCLNFNVELNKCNLIILINEGKSILSQFDLIENCNGFSSNTKCCWYKMYKSIIPKNRNIRGIKIK